MLRYALLGGRLRWRLTLNLLRKGRTALFVLGLVAAAAFAIGGFALLAAARATTELNREAIAVLGVTSIILGWVFLPILSSGADETVDPTRLALLPLTTRELGAVLVGGAVAGPATLAVLVALTGVIAGFAPSGPGGAIVVAVVPCTFLLGLGLSRLVGAGLARAQRSRRGRDAAVVLTALVGVVLWLGTQAVAPALRRADDGTARRVIRVFGWLPTGWAGRALIEASAGRLAAASGWLAATGAAAALALVGWARATALLSVGSERVASQATGDRPPLGRATTPRGAALAREVRYLRRSPSKRVQLLMATLMGVGFAVIQVAQAGHDDRDVFLGLTSMLVTSSAGFNLVGWDSASLWLEDLTGGVTLDRLQARALGWSPHVVVPGILGVLTASVLVGSWRATPVALVETFSIGLLCLGIGAYVSTVAPMSANDGDNPFAWRSGMTGAGCATGLWMLIGIASLGAVAAPTLLPLIIFYDRTWAPLLALGGLVVGAVVFVVGTTLGARRIAGHGPDLIAELSPRAVL